MTLTEEQIAEIKARAEAATTGKQEYLLASIARKDVPALLAFIAEQSSALAAEKRRAGEAEALVYVPGLWKCAKCDFALVKSNLNALDGTITACDKPGDKCPNCNSPLWRVSWKSEAADRLATFEKCFDSKTVITAELSTLRAEVERLREAHLTGLADDIAREIEAHDLFETPDKYGYAKAARIIADRLVERFGNVALSSKEAGDEQG